jgi:hypothetical protein
MGIDSTLPEPHSSLPAEMMTQIVEDYFAFRNAEVEACRGEVERRYNDVNRTFAERREFRRLACTPDWFSRYKIPDIVALTFFFSQPKRDGKLCRC